VPHKLLLADDSVTIQRVIELTFADEDVQVIAVGNGADAIDRVQRDRPDIVLADVGMPERNGYEVAQFIKGTPALAHIPVVLLTGAFEPVDENRARAVGCDGVLVKPFEPQIVISRVKDLLAGKQPAGMWTGTPAAQGPVRPATTGGDAAPGGQAPSAPQHDSLEAYFDHLDAAFAGGSDPPSPAAPSRPANDPIPLSRRPAAAASRSNDPFANWDPDLQGDPARPAAAEPALALPPRTAAAAPQPSVQVAPAPAPAAAPPPPLQIPSLVDAFSALLSAEQKVGLTPSAATVPPLAPASAGSPAPVLTDDMIETISARVLARLSDASRPTILDVAERLVREEIERIKSIG
jgi:CheY-like chemotaxis protein